MSLLFYEWLASTFCSYILWDSKPGFVLRLFLFFFFFQNEGFCSYKIVFIKKQCRCQYWKLTTLKRNTEEIVSKWKDELLLLSKIAEIQPQAAYSAYILGFKNKYNFFNCTIQAKQNHMNIPEDVLRNHFIPAIIGESLISEHLQQLIALPIRIGRMAVPTLISTQTKCIICNVVLEGRFCDPSS